MRRVVCSGDWHADVLTAGFARFDDVEAAVEETVASAIGGEQVERAELYVFLGDLADPDAPGAWRAAELACRTAHRLAEAGVPSVWIVGNHDALEDGSGTSVLEPLAALDTPTGLVRVCSRPQAIRFDRLDVVALPYAARSHEYDPAAFVRSTIPDWVGGQGRRVLVLGHLELDGILQGSESLEMPRGRATFWPVAELLARFGDRALMLAGHYHRRQVHRGVQIVGSLERISFADGTSAPGFVVYEEAGS